MALARSAKYVIELRGGEAKGTINENSPLDVISIIGPNQFGEQSLLEEIGLDRARPFAGRRILTEEVGKKHKYIPDRKRLYSMTEEQYLIVAPVVFGLLQLIVDTRVTQWPTGPFYEIDCRYCRYSQAARKTNEWSRMRQWPRGLRFSVHRESFFAKDVYWAELNLNEIINNFLSGLARFIDMRLARYRTEWKERTEFANLKGVREVAGNIERNSLPPYLNSRLLMYHNNQFATYLAEMFDWNGKSAEEELAESALPDPEFRLGNIQLRVTSGLERRNKGKKLNHYITFEVHASIK